MRRLFVSIGLPPPLPLGLSGLQAGVPGARWVDPANFHVTLRFIGNVEDPSIGEIAALLDRISAPSFDLNLDGVGHFGNGRVKSVLWAGVRRSDPLRFLHDKVDRAVTSAGFDPYPRKFSPHVTLAYAKNVPKPRLADWLAQHALFRSPTIDVTRFSLMESLLGKDGAVYSELAGFDLAPASS